MGMTRRRLMTRVLPGWLAGRYAMGQAVKGQSPLRIVSTAPSLTETLFALGLGPRVVGVSQYCEWPPEVKALPRVGSYVQPNVEAIVRLRPDLVLLERASNEVADRLTSFGIRYAAIPHGTLAETFAGMEKIASVAGIAERGSALVAQIQAALASVRAKAGKSAKVRVLMIVDRRPGTLNDLVATGPGNYEDEVLQIAGGVNVLAKPGMMSYPRISLETVLREDPEVIVDLTDAHDTDAAHLAARKADALLWAREQGLQAARDHRVYIADSTVFLVPGPRVAEAAERLYDALHGGVAR